MAQRTYRMKNLPGRKPRPGAGSAEASEAASPADDGGPRIYGVGELTGQLKRLIEGRFARVQVQGEISGFKRAQSGHCYFTMKDSDAALSAVLFRGSATRVRLDLRDGLEVVATGRLSIYAPRGQYQLIVDRIAPAGEGALRAAFEALRARLEAEGLFAPEGKQSLPALPARVGVVSSPTGAAIHDFLQVLGRRAPQVSVLLAPTRVQGEGAAEEIARALRRLDDEGCDLLVVTRGGGSLEDLWAFNEEAVVRALVACRTPVISAVGHEVDITLSDLAADLRAPTPSAAAELVAPPRERLLEELSSVRQRLESSLRLALGARRQALLLARTHLADPRAALFARRQQLDELHQLGRLGLERSLRARREALKRGGERLDRRHPRRRLSERNRSLAKLERRLQRARPDLPARRAALIGLGRQLQTGSREQLQAARALLAHREAALHALSPQGVLDRGYALVSDGQGRLLRDASRVAVGTELSLRLARGGLAARVFGHHPPLGEKDDDHASDQEEQ